MDDLTICKRIAEIEGEVFHSSASEGILIKTLAWDNTDSVHYVTGKWFRPLTDDALCFRLMVKYGVELSPMFSGCWCATVAKTYTFDEQIDYKLCTPWLDGNPNKAICLAIIEAHKKALAE